MLPVTPIAANTNTAGNAAPEADGSFDSLLQQSSDEPASGEGVPADEQEKSRDDAEVMDAAAQAEIVVMLFATPPVLPLPAVAPEAISGSPIADNAIRETTVFSPEEPTTAPERSVERSTPEPIAPTTRQSARAASHSTRPASEPVRQLVRETAAPQQDAKPLPPPAKEAAPAREVANVLGIIPPVQSAIELSADAAIRSTPALSPELAVVMPNEIPTLASERPVEVAPTVPLNGAPTFNHEAASDEPAIAAAPIDAAPATIAAPTAQTNPAESASIIPPKPAATPQPATALVSEATVTVAKAIEFTGMTAAKPGDGMPAPTLQRSQRPAPVTSAEPVSTGVAPVVTSMDGTQTLHPAAVPAAQNGREHSADDRAENTERQPAPELAATGFPHEMPTTFTGNDTVAPIRSADVAQAVTQTFHAAEQMRVSGQERVEVAVKLDGGHDIIIRLHMANGEVTPTIRTESEPLRLALEQNWSRFSQRGSDSDLRITTPVFESPKTSSNMSDLNQQRDQRQRAFNEPAQEFYQSQTPRRNATPNAPRPASLTPMPANGMTLYA